MEEQVKEPTVEQQLVLLRERGMAVDAELADGHEQELRNALAEADSLSVFALTEDSKQAIAPLVRRAGTGAARQGAATHQRGHGGIRGSSEFKAASEDARSKVDAEME